MVFSSSDTFSVFYIKRPTPSHDVTRPLIIGQTRVVLSAFLCFARGGMLSDSNAYNE